MLLGERGRSPGESTAPDQRQTIERIRRAGRLRQVRRPIQHYGHVRCERCAARKMIEIHVSPIARRAVMHIHRNFEAMRGDPISATTRRSLDVTDFNLKRRLQVATINPGAPLLDGQRRVLLQDCHTACTVRPQPCEVHLAPRLSRAVAREWPGPDNSPDEGGDLSARTGAD